MKKLVTVLGVLLVVTLVTVGAKTAGAKTALRDTGGIADVPYVEVNHDYRISVGMAVVEFEVVSVKKSGLIVATAMEDAPMLRITKGSLWWINLRQVTLVQSKRGEDLD